MFTFEAFLNLPLIWGGLIATAVCLYVLLDGFDLGVGILFPFAPSQSCRDKMMNSIAPFWDGNETWLVLGGGGLFAAFPLAYAVFMPAMYVPVIIMLLCLIFRGVAFEFRFKADKSQFIWDYAFHFGSLGAAFFQGAILGGFIDGINMEGREFSGHAFDWLSGFSMMTGIAVICGYILLGSSWLIMKTDGKTQEWAQKTAHYILIFVALFMAIVSLWVPFLNDRLFDKWFSLPNFYYHLPLPLLAAATCFGIWRSIAKKHEYKPFILSNLLFLWGYIGLAISIWPWVIPYELTLEQGAAANTSLSLLLIGAVVMLPIILIYTGYCYYTFRGKTDDKPHY